MHGMLAGTVVITSEAAIPHHTSSASQDQKLVIRGCDRGKFGRARKEERGGGGGGEGGRSRGENYKWEGKGEGGGGGAMGGGRWGG